MACGWEQGAGKTKATGYEDASIADLPSFEKGDTVVFLHQNQGQGPGACM